ncbi:CLUMA_CG016646, isoform A [Clunio marinus]|uniref:CLUMA_CG016646, isoform A n=1 Tax=Clunio marinus TaxID=568069 RepID=A0A1J1IWI5_9DIPT|nr:CLUMA_CG016646, isoform A [Clunio marinus]
MRRAEGKINETCEICGVKATTNIRRFASDSCLKNRVQFPTGAKCQWQQVKGPFFWSSTNVEQFTGLKKPLYRDSCSAIAYTRLVLKLLIQQLHLSNLLFYLGKSKKSKWHSSKPFHKHSWEKEIIIIKTESTEGEEKKMLHGFDCNKNVTEKKLDRKFRDGQN